MVVILAGCAINGHLCAGEFSLVGRGAVVELHKDRHLPGGGRITATGLSISADGGTGMTGLTAVLGLSGGGGRVELEAGSAGLEDRQRLFIQGGVRALFFGETPPPAEGKPPVLSYAHVRAEVGEYYEGRIELSGLVRLALGKDGRSPVNIEAPTLSYTAEEGIILSGGNVKVHVRAAQNVPPYALTGKSAAIRSSAAHIAVKIQGPGEFQQGGPNPVSGRYANLNLLMFEEDGKYSVQAFKGGNVMVTNSDTTITCRNMMLELDKEKHPKSVACEGGGTLETKIDGHSMLAEFTFLEYAPPTGAGVLTGGQPKGDPMTIQITGGEDGADVNVQAEVINFGGLHKSTRKPKQATQILLSGSVSIQLSGPKDEPPEGFASDMTLTAPSASITELKNGHVFSAKSLSLKGRGKSGEFTLKAGSGRMELDDTFSPTQVLLTEGVELTSAAGKLIGDTATWKEGRWTITGRERPARFVREGVTLETEKVVFDPKTGEVIPEGGEFRVLQNTKK